MPPDRPAALVLAPAGRDAAVAAMILEEVDVPVRICGDIGELVAGLDEAECAVITEEALRHSDRSALAAWVANQPPWSDFPFVLLTFRGVPPDEHLTQLLGKVTVLERPFHPTTLVNAVRSARRARSRQREAERSAEYQQLLVRELHHRVKNTLSTVQALLGATARASESIDEFYHSFSARIVSLAHTHNLLTEGYGQSASLREMLVSELAAYDHAGRIVLAGPEVDLATDLAVPIGMAFHELTTNAAKHGALSVPEGRVEVRWDVVANGTGRTLRIDWREHGGPPVEPPRKKGFGSRLLERVLATQCRAEIASDFAPSGLRFRMEAPLIGSRLDVPPGTADVRDRTGELT